MIKLSEANNPGALARSVPGRDPTPVCRSPFHSASRQKTLRQRWQAHIQSTLSRPVLLVDEAQEMQPAVLAELRLLASADLDSHILLTTVLAGDGRLADRLRVLTANAGDDIACNTGSRGDRRRSGLDGFVPCQLGA
jgi:AAA domain